MDVSFKTTLSTKVCKPLRPVTKPRKCQLLSEMKAILWSMLLLLWEYFDTEKTVTLPLMAFHRDSQLECQCFLSVLPWLFVVNVCLDSQKLATYHKGKREQTLNICFLFHTVLRLWATYFLLCLEQGEMTYWEVFDLESCWEFHMDHKFKSCAWLFVARPHMTGC